MKTNRAVYKTIAEIFYYPDSEFRNKAGDVYQVLEREYRGAWDEYRPFADWALFTEELAQQELFTRTFDVQSITTMDLGYVLFGDDYKRGELLVNLHRELREHGIDARGQLADNLPNVLVLMSIMEDEKILEDLALKIVMPAIDKMVSEFNPQRIAKKNKVYKKHQKAILEKDEDYYKIYECALRALFEVLKEDFGTEIYQPPKQSQDFLKNINTEIELEPSK